MDVKALGISKLVNTFFFIRTVYMMAKVLPFLTLCCIGLQGKQNDFTTAIARKDACVASLKHVRENLALPDFDKKFPEFAAATVNPPAWPRMTARVAARHFDEEEEEPEGACFYVYSYFLIARLSEFVLSVVHVLFVQPKPTGSRSARRRRYFTRSRAVVGVRSVPRHAFLWHCGIAKSRLLL